MLELIGRYRIQERIGEGAMADVYRAHDPSINRSLAIKVLKAEFRQNAEYSTRFLREAKAAGALSHRNIVTIYDVGEVDGYPYIVMELLDGEPLNEVMQRVGMFPSDQVMSIGLQLSDALRYAHALGVVHRDIKPSNIMFDGRDGSIKLLDFGIARIKEAEGLLETDSLKTQVGQVLGTPRYMSPEQALGEEIDGRSDLFSVGVILYELITGKKAFAGGSAATLALQITQQEPDAISNLAPESPRGLQFIISKLLAKKRERRFPDGGQLNAALKRELSAYETVMAEAAASRQRYLPLQVRLTLILGAITAVVLAGSIGAVLVRQYRAMEQMAITAGSAITTFVGANSALPAAERDWVPVAAFVKVASDDPNVQDMVVADADGMVQAATDPSKIGHPYVAPQGGKAVGAAKDIAITSVRTAKGEAFQFVKPITFSGRTVGKVDVSFSKSELESAAMLTRFLLSMLGIVVLGVILVATYALTRMLAQPITRLKAAFAEAARGNFDFRISHSRNDEFGELFEGFNRVAAHVQERFDAVEAVALDRTVLPAGEERDEEPVAHPPADPNSPFATPSEPAAAAAGPDPLPALGPVAELDDPLPELGEPGPDQAAEPLPHFGGDDALPALGDALADDEETAAVTLVLKPAPEEVPTDEEKTVAARPTVQPETTAPHTLGTSLLDEIEGEHERTVIRTPRGDARED